MVFMSISGAVAVALAAVGLLKMRRGQREAGLRWVIIGSLVAGLSTFVDLHWLR